MAASTLRLRAGQSTRWAVLLMVPALVGYLLPGAGAVMIYDRSAIHAGEIWRLVTGHWVHFSASHLFCDMIVLGATGWLIESRGYRYFTVLCLFSALSISLAMLVLLPDMAFYGGLSGIAMASTVYLALHGWREAGPWRGMWLSILILSASKLVFDESIDHFALVNFEDDLIAPAPLSHLTGAASGLVVYLWTTLKQPVHIYAPPVLAGRRLIFAFRNIKYSHLPA